MSSKTAVFTKNAPAPIAGIYSQAIVAGGTVYCSGQVPLDPATGKLIDGDVQAHTVCLHSRERHNASSLTLVYNSGSASRT
jgi:enamine deaminase RidA (YjgF/YER057c/UK114 family)